MRLPRQEELGGNITYSQQFDYMLHLAYNIYLSIRLSMKIVSLGLQ